jgi:hypothetical protein
MINQWIIYSLRFGLLVLRVLLGCQFNQLNKYKKKYHYKSLVAILSNGIIFMLYSLYYVDQINDLDTCAGLVNRKGGVVLSTLVHLQFHNYMGFFDDVAFFLPGLRHDSSCHSRADLSRGWWGLGPHSDMRSSKESVCSFKREHLNFKFM